MKVTRAALPLMPVLPLCQRLLPSRLTGLSLALLKATALDLAILAGHLLLYPSGFTPERRAVPVIPSLGTPVAPVTPAVKETGVAEGTAVTENAGVIEETAAIWGTQSTAAPSVTPDPPSTARLPAQAKPPVVLIHGFIDNRSVFVLLRRSLAQHGRQRIESLNYSPLTCDIRTAAELLGRHIEEICERMGSDRVDVVGHSLGGLIARYYVQRLGGDARVRVLVTLGTPHAGTRVLPLANAHPIVRQMRPGSPVIEELARPAPGCRTHFVSFWSDLDRVMDPLETARLDHPDLSAQNVRVTGIGHLALPVHPAVAAGVRRALDDTPGPETESAGHADGLTVA
ncbi:esterase/lipase family protein [Streptomyces glaucus]|uniref:Alpha/beta fold hydrolase n=1 Tax=Streptomyces glaucus TaxID=284029 RepID=A0ABN3JN44_9ACTN